LIYYVVNVRSIKFIATLIYYNDFRVKFVLNLTFFKSLILANSNKGSSEIFKLN